ncbi:MAG: hypothetical protein K1X81_05650 [Bacteroidia bacterium]|nr:hypothetical protein [Bacteroidia bacterium]
MKLKCLLLKSFKDKLLFNLINALVILSGSVTLLICYLQDINDGLLLWLSVTASLVTVSFGYMTMFYTNVSLLFEQKQLVVSYNKNKTVISYDKIKDITLTEYSNKAGLHFFPELKISIEAGDFRETYRFISACFNKPETIAQKHLLPFLKENKIPHTKTFESFFAG